MNNELLSRVASEICLQPVKFHMDTVFGALGCRKVNPVNMRYCIDDFKAKKSGPTACTLGFAMILEAERAIKLSEKVRDLYKIAEILFEIEPHEALCLSYWRFWPEDLQLRFIPLKYWQKAEIAEVTADMIGRFQIDPSMAKK